MEGKHNTSDHYQHGHKNSAGTEETHHRKESHGGWVCHQCGWTHPNQHPSAKQRRNHKKHCGKIEGFKLINSGETEKRGSSSDVSSDEDHKSTGHTEKEGKHITGHQHRHEQQLHPAEENHHTKEHHGWVCHRCGWTYPNPHPSAKHRKNHKKHCGKIEGFKLISSRDKEIKGGSSDDESSDDELTSKDHEKVSSLKENNVAVQKIASPSTSDCTSSNLDISSSEANVGAIQTHSVSDNATLKPSETIGIDANARNSISFGDHGLNVSGTVESSKNLIGPDMLISEDKSNLFYKVTPDTDNSQYGSGSVEHQELPVKGHQLQNPRHIEAPRTFGKSASTPVHAAKEHNIGIGSSRVGIASILSFNGLNYGNLNPKVSSVEKPPASADTKTYELSQTNHQAYESRAQEVLVSETKEDKMQHHVAIPSDLNEGRNIKLLLGTEGQKDYPPSLAFEPETEKLLQFTSSTAAMDSTSLNNIKLKVTEGAIYSQDEEKGTSNKPENYMSFKNTSPSARRDSYSSEVEKPSDFSNMNSQDMLNPESDNKTSTRVPSGLPEQKAGEETEYPCSESMEKIRVHQQASSEVIVPDQERSADGSSTTYSKAGELKEAESCAFVNSSTIKHDIKICDPNCKKEDSALATEVIDDENSAKSETCQSEYAFISDEKKNTAEYDMFLKPGDYIESKNISPSMHEDSDRYREEEKPPNFENSDSHNILHPEEEKEKIINQEAIKGPSSEGIESTSGQKLDEQASNVVIPDQETSCTDSFPTEYSKEGERQQTKFSSITSSSTIEHDTKDYKPECRTTDSTPENIVMPATTIVRDADTLVNEVANENQEAIKGLSSEGIESTSGQKLDEQASNVVILDQETSGTNIFPTEYSKEGEKQQTECSSITSSSTIAHDMKDYSPDCRTADSTLENIVMSATNIVRDADTPVNEVANENQEAIKVLSSEGIESTSGQKLDEQASNVVTLDQETSGTDSFTTKYSKEGENQQRECSSITSSGTIEHDMKDYNPDCKTTDSTTENILMPATDNIRDADIPVNEVANEKSVAVESHHPESVVYNNEQKSNVEQGIFVNSAENIEFKEICSLEKAKVMKEPCFGGIETTLDQKFISQDSSKLVITDEAMSSADSPPIEYSGLGESQQNECSAPTKSSIVEPCVRDSDPDSKNDSSIQGNIMLRDVDRDGHIDANINAQESLSEAVVTEVVHANSVASESAQSNARNTYSSSQDVACANFGAQLPEEELQYKHHEQGLEHSGVEQSNQFTSCSSTTTIADNSLQVNGSSTYCREDSSKESMDDVHGSKTESLKTFEPALWEQLLESNAKESNNPETCQDLGNPQQSPDNPFIYGQSFSSKKEAHQTFHIEGGHGLVSEQLKNNSAEGESALPLTNNGLEKSPTTNFGYKGEGNTEALKLKENTSDTKLEAPADIFEAPSFVTLVEKSNHSESWPSHHEIQPNADLAPGGSQNGEFSAEAAESEYERLERSHKPLRNLLAEETMRGTQDRSKQEPPLIEQPQPSSLNKIQGVHASTVHMADEGGTSSLNLEIAQKDSSSASKKILEKVWNSPARLPSPKAEKQKVKVKSAWSMCLCGSAAN